MSSYPTEEVDSVVDNLATALQATLEELKASKEETALWRKQAEENRVYLDKVASEKQELENKQPFSVNLIDSTIDKLISLNLLGFDQREKFASDLQSKPDEALRLTQKLLLTISAPAHQGGRGIPKSAAAKSGDDDSSWM